jgi:ubiquinone/menaquinone biosynthesis C-methylase UbiE
MKPTAPYSLEPDNPRQYTRSMDQAYTWFAGFYDVIVKMLPVWRKWIGQALPHIQGQKVLEVSFGTGYLLTQYASQYETFGLDYNRSLIKTARRNLTRCGLSLPLCQASVETLPYPSNHFDTIVNTMAFTGYPDGRKAIGELHRVLKPGGRLVMVDIGYPISGRKAGMFMARTWVVLGDILRDMSELLSDFDFMYETTEIGGFGSVQLHVATKG